MRWGAAIVLGALAASPASAQPAFSPRAVTPAALDVSTITTGGTAVTAILPGNRLYGGYLQNPVGAAQSLCIDETGATAVGTVSSGTTICIPAGGVFRVAPSPQPVSAIASDSAHVFAGSAYR